MKKIVEKIKDRTIVAGVIGLGYVGLPLVMEMAEAGYKVIGFEVSNEKIESANKGISYVLDVSNERLKKVIDSKMFEATNDFSRLSEVDTISICVPTPLRKTKDPDISYIVEASKSIKKSLKAQQLIVLESTTYPGTTDEIILPILQKDDMEVGKDFYLAFSPERVDPGNEKYNTKNTPKVIGGCTPDCTEYACKFYNEFIDTVVPVSSTREAEMVKLLENTFRSVNIGLVNELMLMGDRMGIDIWEVVDAAATKPFGFMPFYPGPGLGGHCIPIDPIYLSWKARSYNFYTRFIELAQEINENMPRYVVQKISDALNYKKRSVNESKILIIGVAYKPDIDDVRESPALEVIFLTEEKGGIVEYYDPYISTIEVHGKNIKSIDKLTESVIKKYDCVVITTNHSKLDYEMIKNNSNIVVDARNAYKNKKHDNILKI